MNTHYCGSVTMADQAVTMIMNKLREYKLLDNTMIVVVGDQGSMLGEHQLYDKGPYCYDELMHIPLITYVPNSAAHTIKRQVSLIDLHQTVVEYLDLRLDNKPRFSRSLMPLIRQDEHAWAGVPDEAYYRYEWYNGRLYGVRAIRTPTWKYCFNPASKDELYNLQDDPKELNNRYQDQNSQMVMAQLQQRLLSHLQETKDPMAERFADVLRDRAARNKK
jgi:arylsulfatase A-like enzyme